MNNHNGNGAAEPALPQATELVLSNGIKLWAYPVTQRDNRELILAWQKANPEPDRAGFEKPLDPEFASYEGQKLPAEENPAYQQMIQDRKADLNAYVTRAYLLGYTEVRDVREQDLIERYARMIARKRLVMDIPENEWEATLLYAVIETVEDQRNIIRAVERSLPIEMGEIIDQVAIFRPVNQRNAAGKVPHRRSKAQSTEAETESEQDHIESGV